MTVGAHAFDAELDDAIFFAHAWSANWNGRADVVLALVCAAVRIGETAFADISGRAPTIDAKIRFALRRICAGGACRAGGALPVSAGPGALACVRACGQRVARTVAVGTVIPALLVDDARQSIAAQHDAQRFNTRTIVADGGTRALDNGPVHSSDAVVDLNGSQRA
jgi:hypothetical protein